MDRSTMQLCSLLPTLVPVRLGLPKAHDPTLPDVVPEALEGCQISSSSHSADDKLQPLILQIPLAFLKERSGK